MFDPGEDFAYGFGFDWLALIIEKLDGRNVEQFCQEEIFGPLGMADTVFEPDFARERLAAVKVRGADGSLWDLGDFAIGPPPHPEVYGLGQALYSTASDYVPLPADDAGAWQARRATPDQHRCNRVHDD